MKKERNMDSKQTSATADLGSIKTRINEKIKRFPLAYRDKIRKGALYLETSAMAQSQSDLADAILTKAPEGHIKRLQLQVMLVPVARRILYGLRVGKAWACSLAVDNGAEWNMNNKDNDKVEFEGLLFEYKGFHLGFCYRDKNPGKWRIFELTTGASFGSFCEKSNIGESIIMGLSAIDLVGERQFQKHIDSWTESYGRTPYQPKKSESALDEWEARSLRQEITAPIVPPAVTRAKEQGVFAF
jgi:hypothetical protein